MADIQKHAGTLDDPIPDGFIYKSPIDKKIHTFVSANFSSGGGNVQVEDATDTIKGVAKLSDAVDGTEDAASGVTAATPLAVKTLNDKITAVEAANTDQDARLTAIETKNTTQDSTLDDHKQRIETLEQGGAGGTPVADATDAVKGITKLSDAVDTDLDAATGKTAATPKAVKDALEQAKAYADAHQGGGSSADATDTVKGINMLSDAIDSNLNAATGVTAATPLAVKLVHNEVTTLSSKVTQHEQTLTDHGNRIDALESSGGATVVLVPKITAPTQGEVDVLTTFTISGTPYVTLLESDQRKHRRFELSKNKSFDVITWSKEVNEDSVEVTPPVDESTDFYIRIRDVSTAGYVSAWSPVIKFTSGGASKVSKPTVTITGGTTDVQSMPVFTGSTFAIEPEDQNDPQQHISTTWTLRKFDGNAVIWTSADDTVNKTSLTLPKGHLQVSTKYIMEMSYTSQDHGSSAVAKVEFTTAAEFTYIVTPTITIATGTTNVGESPTFNGSAFTVAPEGQTDTHTASTWWVTRKSGEEVYRVDRDTSKLTIMTLPKGKLDPTSDYIVHLIYHGTTWGNSEEATLEFRTNEAFTGIKLPIIKLEDHGADKDKYTPDMVFVIEPSIDYANPNAHVDRTSWELYEGDTKVWYLELSYLTRFLTGFYFGNGSGAYKLKPSTTYKLRAQHLMSSSKYSDWTEFYFTTNDILTFPSLQFKMRNTINIKKIIGDINPSDYEFYVDGTLSSDLKSKWDQDFTLPVSGATIKIVNVANPIRYPKPTFAGSDLTLKDNLLELIELPYCASENLGGIGSYIRGDNGESSSGTNGANGAAHTGSGNVGYGCFSKCTAITSLSDLTFKYNQQITHLGGIGGSGGSGGNGGSGSWGRHKPTNGIGGNGGDGSGNGGDGYGCFAECTSLISIPEDLFKYNGLLKNLGGVGGSFGHGGNGGRGGDGYKYNGGKGGNGGNGSGNGGNGYGCFYKCTSLKNLPNNLFKNNHQACTFGGSIEIGQKHDISTGGFGGSGGDASSRGTGGTGGNGGNSSGATGNGYGCFAECSALISIPEDLFKYANGDLYLGGLIYADGRNFGGGSGGSGGNGNYQYSGGLGGNGGASGNGDNIHIGSVYGCFYKCTNLSTLPSKLFDVQRTLHIGINCTYGTRITANGGRGGNGGNGHRDTDGGAGGNGGIGGSGGIIGDISVADGYGCFAECTSLTSIPEDIFKYAKSISDVGVASTLISQEASLGPTGNNGFAYGSGAGYGGSGGSKGSIGTVTYDGQYGGCFGKCKSLNMICRFNQTSIGPVRYFAADTVTRGTVYVPRGSYTASSFKSEPTANVNVIEE